MRSYMTWNIQKRKQIIFFELKIQLLKGAMYNRLNNRLANDGEQMS